MDLIKKFKKFYNMFSLENKLATAFSVPFLIFLLPRTYWRLFKNIIKSNKNKKYIIGFSPYFALIFTWYLRAADCVKKYGRRGYVYEDGLGVSLKERFWLNAFTLKLYNGLKIRKFTILTSLILILNIIIIGLFENVSIGLLLILILLIIGSPLFLTPFFRLAKPETLSWAFFALALYSFLNGYYIISAILCAVIAFLNFTTTVLLIETIFLYAVLSYNFFNGFLVLIAPGIILLYDLIPFLKNQFVKTLLEILGGRKSKSRTDEFLRIRLNDIYLNFFYLILIISFIIEKTPISHIIIMFNPLILFIVDRNIFRFADNNTFFRFFFVISSMFVLMHINILSFAMYIILLYLSPISLMEVFESIPKNYPHLKPYSLAQSKKFLENFSTKITSQSRIIFEAKDTERGFAGFSTILFYLDYIFLKKGIELLPMEWLRMTQFNYFIKQYIKVNYKSSKDVIEQKCKELGAQYLMVYSEKFAQNLKYWNYKKIATLGWEDMERTLLDFEKAFIPKKDLFIFKVPFNTSLINPTTKLDRKPNKMEFIAHANTEYIIKYNFHPSWRAYQNSKEMPVYAAKGVLSYIALRPENDGKVVLKFNTHWLP